MHLLLTITPTADRLIQAFSWMLIHSLWQGLLLAVVTAVILLLTKRSAAAVRYNLVLMQFSLFMVACAGTFMWEWNRSPVQDIVPLAGAIGKKASHLFNLDAAGVRQFAHTCISYFTANAPMVVLLWFVLFVFRSVRMMGSLVYIHRAKNRHTCAPADYWKNRIAVLCQQLQLKRAVQLLESGYVKMPMVIGHLKPVILVPVGLLAGLPAEQVEAVLLHELAHIRRHDYFVNFLQTLAETVFFFNPGLVWISSLLRDERENCCDDIAIAQTKNRREFVQALISFKEHALYGNNYAVAFPGKKNHLLNRVSRIMSNKNKTLGPSEKVFFMMGIVILSAVIATAAIAQIKTAAPGVIKTMVKISESDNEHESVTVSAIQIDNKTDTKATPMIVVANRPKDAEPAIIKIVANPEAPEPPAPAPPAVTENHQAENEKAQQKRDQEQAIRDQDQARREQDQAKRDQEQAVRDQQQARLDQMQAKRDKEQALRDQEQAAKDQAEVKRNEEQSRKNDEQAKVNSVQSAYNNEQAKANDIQAKKNNERVRANTEQAARNAVQDVRNKEQVRINQEQAKKNVEQAKRNNRDNVSIQE